MYCGTFFYPLPNAAIERSAPPGGMAPPRSGSGQSSLSPETAKPLPCFSRFHAMCPQKVLPLPPAPFFSCRNAPTVPHDAGLRKKKTVHAPLKGSFPSPQPPPLRLRNMPKASPPDGQRNMSSFQAKTMTALGRFFLLSERFSAAFFPGRSRLPPVSRYSGHASCCPHKTTPACLSTCHLSTFHAAARYCAVPESPFSSAVSRILFPVSPPERPFPCRKPCPKN